jgi:uncharacterized sodium:solute symporter family permease YidK
MAYAVIARIFVILFISGFFLSINFKEIDSLFKSIPESFISLFPLSLLIWLWSKKQNEDDFVRSVRLKAMQIAVYICYGLFMVLTWLVYGFDYLGVLYLGFLALLIIFFIVFYSQLQLQKRRKHFDGLQVSDTKS